MDRMLTVKRTIFLEFQLFLGIPPVFACGVVFPLAFAALERYQFHNLFLARHFLSPKTKMRQTLVCAFWSALDQNRTDDLILTMDMLCQLSYKGTIR